MALRRTVARLSRNTGRTTSCVGAQQHHRHQNEDHHCGDAHRHHNGYTADVVQKHHFWSRTWLGKPFGLASFSTQAVPSSEGRIEVHDEKAPLASLTIGASGPALSNQETRKLLKLVKVDDFKKLLISTGNQYMPMDEVLKLCKKSSAATTDAEAEEIIRHLDEAGVILIFRNRVFPFPSKVADLLAKTMPFHLTSENDPRVEELAKLQKEKKEIDRIAHRQVRNMLWGALGAFSLQSAIFFRLTFWDLSWDVMEPITFFVTSSSLLAGFFFFVLTHRDPSYQDLMNTLLSNKQRKLMKKRRFDEGRFKELQVQCCIPNQEYHFNFRH